MSEEGTFQRSIRAVRASAAVVLLLLTHTALLAWGAYVHSPAIDEVGHLPAGLSHWQLGRFGLYRVNPPLVRMVAAVPVLFAGPEIDWTGYTEAPGARAEFALGQKLIADNGSRSFWYFTLARWACIPFSLLGGYVCYRWARELYGPTAGLLALALWCFCPNILANAQMITPDTGAAALGVAAAYLFWRWLKQPTWTGAFAAGAVLGLAELTKTSWLLLFGLWPALWLVWRLPRPAWLRETGQLALVLGLGVYVLNVGYGFEGTFGRLGDYEFVSETLAGPRQPGAAGWEAGNRFAGTWAAALPVPVPRNYLMGIDTQKHDFEAHFLSYLRGEWRREGWWYYYLYGLGVKVPLGTWALVLLAVALGLCIRRFAAAWRDELTVLAPAVVLLVLVSAQTGFNHHLRYILPIFPFAFIWMSKAARAVDLRRWKTAALVGAAVAWSVASSLMVYPHSLSYFNELAGGPENGHAHLVDSNIDWGQDLLFLKGWLDEHPEARPLGLAYFGGFDPRVAGIEFTLPPKGPVGGAVRPPKGEERGPRPGWYAVSVVLLRGYHYSVFDGRGGAEYLEQPYYAYFQRFRPVARAGYSICIYHVTPEEADQVRQELEVDEEGETGRN